MPGMADPTLGWGWVAIEGRCAILGPTALISVMPDLFRHPAINKR
jgi:hypothetical protein